MKLINFNIIKRDNARPQGMPLFDLTMSVLSFKLAESLIQNKSYIPTSRIIIMMGDAL